MLAALAPHGFRVVLDRRSSSSSRQHGHRRRLLDRGSAPVLASVRLGPVRSDWRSPIASTSRRRGRARRPLRAGSSLAVAIGAAIGIALTIAAQGLLARLRDRAPEDRSAQLRVAAFFNGLFVSLFFLFKYREARAADRAAPGGSRAAPAREAGGRGRAEADAGAGRAAFPVQHAGVGAVPDRDRSAAGHAPAGPSARLPARGAAAAAHGDARRWARRSTSPRPISTFCKMRMGARLEFAIDVPEALRAHPFPPVLLISVVENAITHGLEPQAEGGTVRDRSRRRRRPPRRDGDRHRPRPRRRTRGPDKASGSPTCASASPRCSTGARASRWRRPRRTARARRSRSRSRTDDAATLTASRRRGRVSTLRRRAADARRHGRPR